MHNLNNNCHVYRASSRPQGQIKENKRHLNFFILSEPPLFQTFNFLFFFNFEKKFEFFLCFGA